MNERTRHGWLFWLSVALVVLPVLYVLSIGPAFWVLVHFQLSDDADTALRPCYRPLFWVCNTTDTLSTLWWYVGLWIGPLEPVEYSANGPTAPERRLITKFAGAYHTLKAFCSRALG